MPAFKRSNETGDTSEYESDGGTIYVPRTFLGTGAFDRVRSFVSKGGARVAITQPINSSEKEDPSIRRKCAFLETMHPGSVEFMRLDDQTYVLRTPEASGETYQQIGASDFTLLEKIKLFLSATQALSVAQAKRYVVIDVKEDNMFYDSSTGKTTLIDGGLSSKNGETANQHYQCRSEQQAKEKRQKCSHIAPEFFSTSVVIARHSMDVYSLGSMMKRMLGTLESPLGQLIEDCLNENPKSRPTLRDLEGQLSSFEWVLSTVGFFY